MKKRLLLIIFLLLTISFETFIIYKQGQLDITGNYYDNLADFGVEREDEKQESSPLAQAYLKGITYEIIDIDKENMKATVKVSVPQVTDVLVQIIDKILEENAQAEAAYIKECVIQELQSRLEKNVIPKATETLFIPLKKELFAYKLNPGEEWYDVIMGQLEEMYIEYFRLMIGEMTNEEPNN